MKKFAPLVALLATVAFSAPVFATEHDAAPAKAEKAEGKKAHKGHKGKAHKGKKAKPCHKGAAMSSEGTASAPVAVETAPSKVWMPSMRHGFKK